MRKFKNNEDALGEIIAAQISKGRNFEIVAKTLLKPFYRDDIDNNAELYKLSKMFLQEMGSSFQQIGSPIEIFILYLRNHGYEPRSNS